jgi:hypothetical protein
LLANHGVMRPYERDGSDIHVGAVRVRVALSDLLRHFGREHRQERSFRAGTRLQLGTSGGLVDVPAGLSSHGRGRMVSGESVWVTEATGLRKSRAHRLVRLRTFSN